MKKNKNNIRKCTFCKTTENIYVITDKKNPSKSTLVCSECFKNFCEECKQLKEVIFNKRKIHEKNHIQICSECYEKYCKEIIQLDKQYSINSIDNFINKKFKEL